jgi:hypothetical protein
VAEDEPEYDCVIRLACIGQQLLDWAQGEATEYGADAPMPMTAYLAAGIEAFEKKEEEPTLNTDMMLIGIQASIEAAIAEAQREAQKPPAPHVPESSGHDGLTHFARRRARPRFGG